jgi:signal transduction histidine kinase
MQTMSTVPATAPRRLYRQRDGRLVAGVARGLSEHLGVDVLLIRIGFVVTIVLGGLGVVLYAAFWAVVPQSGEESFIQTAPGASTSRRQLALFAALGLLMLLAAQFIGFGPGVLWPAAAAVTGAAILWRQADESSRLRWRSLTLRGSRLATETSPRGTVLRYGSGLLLVVVGMVTFLAAHVALPQARRAVLPVLVVVLGLIFVIGPWMLQALRQLNAERTARIREHERVEFASRVHDSMLQTLTLIEQRVNEPDEVLRLVRRSERELRGWLYSPTPPAQTLRAAILAVCADVEDEYAVTVDLIMVGDHPATDAADALIRAVGEATVNAAKHSGVKQISVYVEVSATEIVVFVRDRGHGFDPSRVPADRYGVKESVVARMQRHGGDAVIRSSSTTGTEVRLNLPLQSPART